jgi:hypothetical protein
MNVRNVVKEVTAKVKPLQAKGTAAAKVSLGTLKQANAIVADGAKLLARKQKSAGKDLIAAARKSIDKAKADGLIAVASAPAEYLPATRERLVSAYADTLEVVGKAGSKIAKVVQKGYEEAAAELTGKPKRRRRSTAASSARGKAASTTPASRTRTKAAVAPARKPAAKKSAVRSTAAAPAKSRKKAASKPVPKAAAPRKRAGAGQKSALKSAPPRKPRVRRLKAAAAPAATPTGNAGA